MSLKRSLIGLSLIPLLLATAFGKEPQMVNQSARRIPVAYRVDVVVVGGGTGAVAAAVAAAENGAKVFLAAGYPYLGDDMTANLRLWLEPGEEPGSPLARRIFSDPRGKQTRPDPNRIKFTYTTDRPGVDRHKDTNPPRMLADGIWGNAATQSVQYDGDVNITADLGKPGAIREIHLVVYHRAKSKRAENFKVEKVTVLLSDDGKTWKKVAARENPQLQREEGHASNEPISGKTLSISLPVGQTARYVKLAVEKTDDVERMLLGEVEIISAGSESKAASPKYPPPRPMHVKKTLDDVLLESGVEFLYSCRPTDVLRDADGNPCGLVMANRAGRQAVVAKTIIDATDRAVVARMAGAEFRPYPAGAQKFRRTVIGGEVQTGSGTVPIFPKGKWDCPPKGMSARIIDPPFVGPHPNAARTASGRFQIIEYTLQLPMADDGYASFAAADQVARSLTYHPEQQFTSDRLFQVPPDAVRGGKDRPLGAFRPANMPMLWILGGCADVSRPQAEQLLRPLQLIGFGEKLGEAAARLAGSMPKPSGVHLPGKPVSKPAAAGDVHEMLGGVRPTQELPTIEQQATALPVLGRYDVVVIGGGTAGAPAGIAAARKGAKTLVVEYLHGLGGVGTVGAISKYYFGNRVGFSATVPGRGSWVIEQKMEWWRTELLKAGADIWFGTLGCGAFVDGDRVAGAVVVTPHGRGVVLAKVVIDATGNSDVAAAAGAECLYTDASEFGMQGTGLPPRRLGATYTNTDFTIVDETDMVDVWHMFVYAKRKYPEAFDQGQLIDTRERRRIVGDFTVTLLDQVNRRTFHDSVVRAYSNFDTHGYTVDPYCMIEHPGKRGFYVYVPYRCMLPKGRYGILVAGLGISAHRDAVPMIRMQPDIQNGGYAAGVAAATAAEGGTLLRNLDVRQLQKHLVEIGNLPESVLKDRDSYPMPDEKVAAAVESVCKGGAGAAVIFANPDRALPLLKKLHAEGEGKQKSAAARLLCTLGSPAGLQTLIDEVAKTEKWDRGWNYRGMGQFGQALSPLDIQIVAMGRARDPRCLPAIFEKMALLTADDDFSHHRAVGLAAELIGEKKAAQPLAELLSKPGMQGYVHTTVAEAARQGVPGGTSAVTTRRHSLRELLLARALYRCGDHEGLGRRILEAYTKDLRGHVARHAQAVLKAE